jgi:D-glycero-alpha-D-manno-heptose-7-phosphate kinase
MGGGTDLPSFHREEEGMVLSTALNKYMHVTVNDRFDETYRLSYSRTEICSRLEEIEHPIFRRVLEKYAPPGRGLELISMADIPSGTGLGSSSSFTVGLLHAVKAHLGIFQSAEDLASEASSIEIEDLREPIGKQDQYAAAYGGLSVIRFLPGGPVSVEPVICADAVKKELEAQVMLFYTGRTRAASQILSEQKRNTESRREELREMRDLVPKLKAILESGRGLEAFGRILHEGWELKKKMASGISDPEIDDWYGLALEAGATGGKILGAGGGGFLMLLVPPDRQARVRQALPGLREVSVAFEKRGSRIIFLG